MDRTVWYRKWQTWAVAAAIIIAAVSGIITYQKISEHNRIVAAQQAQAREKARAKAYADAVLKRAYIACNKYTDSDAALHDTLDLAAGNDSLQLDSPATALNTYETYHCLADKTSMPESVQDKIGQTNAYSGMQSDSWDNIKATWSYNGNTGLSITLERRK